MINTLILLKLTKCTDSLYKRLDEFVVLFEEMYSWDGEGSRTVFVDQNNKADRGLDTTMFRIMNNLKRKSFYRSDLRDVKADDNFRRVIIITDSKTKIRSTYYEILGKRVPSELVRIFLVDEK